MLEKFNKVGLQNILVVGDIILDKYVFGITHRISPEAPVPVVNLSQRTMALGGAANVAANLKALGSDCFLIGAVGNDDNGQALLSMINEDFQETNTILILDRPTTTKTRVLSKGQQLLRIDEEETHDLSLKNQQILITAIKDVIDSKSITGIILQDYNKGIFTENSISQIIELASDKNLPIFVDPKHKNFWKYKNATIFKPNLSELRHANIALNESPIESILKETYHRLKCKMLICTMAEKGNAIVENGTITFCDTEKIDVVDVSGAGDSSLAIITLSYLLGYNANEIATLANLCGRVACMQTGVSTISLEQIQNAF